MGIAFHIFLNFVHTSRMLFVCIVKRKNMDFLELVKLRHSVRQYSAREVEKEKLEYIVYLMES